MQGTAPWAHNKRLGESEFKGQDKHMPRLADRGHVAKVGRTSLFVPARWGTKKAGPGTALPYKEHGGLTKKKKKKTHDSSTTIRSCASTGQRKKYQVEVV